MDVAELSTVLVWGATTTYAIALVAFALDMARRAEVLGRAREEARLAAEAEGVPAPRAGLLAMRRGGSVVIDRPGTVSGPGGYRPGKALSIAMSTTVLAVALQVVGTVLRGIAAGRVPWANLYEFTLIATLAAVVTFLALNLRRDVRFLGVLVIGLVTIALGVGLTAFYVPAAGVEPALQSYWLVIHVSIATIASGLFAVSAAASVLQLLKDSWENASPALAHRRWALLDSLPSARALEALAFRVTAVGFVLWTFTVVTGAVWAETAWARYWGWDPKEVWSFVVWVVYAAYLHARTTRGWSGRRASWFVLVGFATVVFNFTAVNLLLQGKHSYSGLTTGS
ncbi:c-type cytochrome biogenesis protein CcsB [Actinotalea sp.]|uniref:c-type cytochrome biogenesis protein CcsB n=1 Tax=Actinotalea sp. TaxID=1872145 RepID=UPI003562D279